MLSRVRTPSRAKSLPQDCAKPSERAVAVGVSVLGAAGRLATHQDVVWLEEYVVVAAGLVMSIPQSTVLELTA